MLCTAVAESVSWLADYFSPSVKAINLVREIREVCISRHLTPETRTPNGNNLRVEGLVLDPGFQGCVHHGGEGTVEHGSSHHNS